MSIKVKGAFSIETTAPGVWLNEQTLPALQNITKFAAVEYVAGGTDIGSSIATSTPLSIATNRCAFSPNGDYFAVGLYGTSPFIAIYKRSENNFTKLSNPATLPTGSVQDCAFSPDSNYLVAAHENFPYITIYKRSGDTFTKLSNPATLPSGGAQGCTFSPDGTYLVINQMISGVGTIIYKRNGDVFTKLSNPSSPPGSYGTDCAFSPDGIYLVITQQAPPSVIVYKRSGDIFTKLSTPTNTPSDATACDFSPDGTYIAVGSYNSDGADISILTIYKRSGDTFTQLNDPIGAPRGSEALVTALSFSPDSSYLAMTYALIVATGIEVYSYSNDVFTKMPVPSFSQFNNVSAWGCDFSPDETHLALSHNGAPYLTVFKNSSSLEGIRNITPNGFSDFATNRLLGVGMALEDAVSGQNVRVNLLKPINDVWSA